MHAVMTAPGPSVGILGLDHVRLAVDDLDRAVRFYRDVLGAELVDRYDRNDRNDPRAAADRPTTAGRPGPTPRRAARATFRVGRGLTLQLVVAARRAPAGDERPLWAFAIAPADVAVFRQRLTDAGVAHVGPVAGGPLCQASIYLHDPAGNLLELTTTGYPGDVVV